LKTTTEDDEVRRDKKCGRMVHEMLVRLPT